MICLPSVGESTGGGTCSGISSVSTDNGDNGATPDKSAGSDTGPNRCKI